MMLLSFMTLRPKYLPPSKQGTDYVIDYYCPMKSLWLELDHYQNTSMKYIDDSVKLQEYVERERILRFWQVSAEFDQIRVQVLGRKTLSSLNQTFSVIGAEESHIMVMLVPKITKGSALMSMKPNKEGFRNQQQNLNLVPQQLKIEMCFGILSLRSQTIRRRHGGSHMGSIQEQGMKVIGRKVSQRPTLVIVTTLTVENNLDQT
ncbi:UNVERIFIED_CONTAM: hypothetical protein Sangu_2645700 [Sesamum angustifolium]|uniref:Uncharacterized protein n=1 Tax=Sesamum angustifolium TaxID=2727405 RepID=A0AAW2J1X8_9LAMI